jgi:beta-lactamase regulating signal transducer with metallopeptidase domain
VSAAWVVYLLVAGTLLALGARAVAATVSLTGRSTRWVWAATLAGVLALGLVAPRARSFDPMVTANATSAQTITAQLAPRRPRISAFVEAARGAIETTVARSIVTASSRVSPRAVHVFALAWSIASAVLLLLYLIVNLRVSRARRHWPRERLHGLEVRVAPSAGPAVIGVLRADIVVPHALLERSVEEQRLILAHEHEHLRARDNVLLGFACVAVIVLPWHPAAWYLLARLRLAIELDCDARVLRGGAAPRSYGALLIDMAAHGAGMRVGTLALADRPTHLERRLMAMRSSRSRYAVVRGGAMSAVAGLLVLAACEAKVPTAAELSSMGVRDMQKSAATSGVFGETRFANADFFFDGARITREEVTELDASRIGSMEIVKGARDTIFVTSKERLAQLYSADTAHMKTRSRGTPIALDGSEPRTMVRTPGSGPNAAPAIMIDGVISTETALAALHGEDIVTVNVMKPKNGASGGRYPNGLIAIETKAHQAKASKAPDVLRSMESHSKRSDPTRYTVNGQVVQPPTLKDVAQNNAVASGWSSNALPAFTIDGVRATREQFTALSRDKIARVDVLKGAAATLLSSDPAAVNGLVQVTTLTGAKQ